MESIRKWKIHSNQESFRIEFDDIIHKYRKDNDSRTVAVEAFLVKEAEKAGVIKMYKNKL